MMAWPRRSTSPSKTGVSHQPNGPCHTERVSMGSGSPTAGAVCEVATSPVEARATRRSEATMIVPSVWTWPYSRSYSVSKAARTAAASIPEAFSE